MLNEIFKGMDNAAEKINENFEKTGIKVNQNEDGYYAEIGNELAICWREVTFVRGTSGTVGTFQKPITFKEGTPLFGGISSAPPTGSDRTDAWRLMLTNRHNSWSINRNYNDFDGWEGTGELTIYLWAAGLVEDV